MMAAYVRNPGVLYQQLDGEGVLYHEDTDTAASDVDAHTGPLSDTDRYADDGSADRHTASNFNSHTDADSAGWGGILG